MTYQEAARWLREREGYLILTHKNPDGDTVGCAAALCEGLRALGKTAHICPGTGETRLFTPYLEGYLAPAEYVPETVVSVDIAARSLFTAEEKSGWSGGSTWPSTTIPLRNFLRRKPVWTPDGPPAAS